MGFLNYAKNSSGLGVVLNLFNGAKSNIKAAKSLGEKTANGEDISVGDVADALPVGSGLSTIAGVVNQVSDAVNGNDVATGELIGTVADVLLTGKVVKGASGSSAKPQAPVTNEIYQRPRNATTAAQRKSVQGQPCVDCGFVGPVQVADHITPLVKEWYETGTIDLQRMRSVDAVQPQCATCSAQQGGQMSQYSKKMKKTIQNRTGGGSE